MAAQKMSAAQQKKERRSREFVITWRQRRLNPTQRCRLPEMGQLSPRLFPRDAFWTIPNAIFRQEFSGARAKIKFRFFLVDLGSGF
jgi:hypothetical protein